MNHVERVLTALACGQPDRVPRGEFELEPGLVAALLGCRGPVGFAEAVAARGLLGMDLLALTPEAVLEEQGDGNYRDNWGRVIAKQGDLTAVRVAAIPEIRAAASYRLPAPESFNFLSIRRWREETDFFIFAFLDGPFQGTGRLFNFTDFLLAVAREKFVGELAAAVTEFNLKLARLCREAGAHGIIIGDDVAYSRGTYIHPDLWRTLFLPHLRRLVEGLKKLDLPVLFHSDGNLNAILPDLAGLPLNGFQCLEPAAGMDIGAVKREYGKRLCLMGNFDPGLLAAGSPEEITSAATRLLAEIAPGGGYIFSTSSGILNDALPVDNVRALYQAVADNGNYQ